MNEHEAEFLVPWAGKSVDLPDPEIVRRAAMRLPRVDEASAEANEEGANGLLSLAEAAERMGWTAPRLEAAIKDRQVLAVNGDAGTPLIPAFQLDLDPSVLASILRPVLGFLEPVCASDKTIWLWFLAPKHELGGQSPVRWMSEELDGTTIVLAAERDAARLAAG